MITPKSRAKPFAWSYSKLKNFEQCPKRHCEIDLLRTYKDTGGEALEWGNAVHDRVAKYLRGEEPLWEALETYRRWIDAVKNGPGNLLVEQKYAITKEFAKTMWSAPNAWYRGIGDAVRLNAPVALIIDWKTGKVLDDSVQLGLMAQCIFAQFPSITHVRSEFIWLKEDCSTPEVFTREETRNMWVGLLPRVATMEQAAVTQTYPPKPGGLCRAYCPVQSCPYWRKGDR